MENASHDAARPFASPCCVAHFRTEEEAARQQMMSQARASSARELQAWRPTASSTHPQAASPRRRRRHGAQRRERSARRTRDKWPGIVAALVPLRCAACVPWIASVPGSRWWPGALALQIDFCSGQGTWQVDESEERARELLPLFFYMTL